MAPAKGKSSRHRSHKEDDEDDSSDGDARKSGKHRERLHRRHSASEDEDVSSDGAARKSSRTGKHRRISCKGDDQDAFIDGTSRKSDKHRDSDKDERVYRRIDEECRKSDKDERIHKREDYEDDGAARKSGKHRDSDKDEQVHRRTDKENRKRRDSDKDERVHRRTDDEDASSDGAARKSGKHRGHRRDEDVSSDREARTRDYERTRKRSGKHSDDSSDGEHRKSSRVSKHRDYDKDRGHKRRHSASEHHSSKKTKPQSPSALQVSDLGEDSSSKNDARNRTETDNQNKQPPEDVEDLKDDRGRTRHNDSGNAVEKKSEHKEQHRSDKEERNNELKDEELRKSDKKHRQKDEHDNKFHSDSKNREDRRYDSDYDHGHYRREDSEYRSRNSRDHRDVKRVYEEDRHEYSKVEDERREPRRRHYRDEDEDRYARRSYRDDEYVHRSYRESHMSSREEPRRREWSRDSRGEKFDRGAEGEHGHRRKASRESKDEKAKDLDLQNGKERQITSTKAGDENGSKSHSNDLYNEEDHRKGEKELDTHERSVHRGTSSSRSSMRNEDGYGRKHGGFRRNEDIWSWGRAQGVYSPFGPAYGAGFPSASMYGAAQMGYFGYPWYAVPSSVIVEDPGQTQDYMHIEYPQQTEEFQRVMEVENVPEEAGACTDTVARAASFKATRFSGQMKQLVSRLSVSEELAGQETLEKYQKFISDEHIQPPAADTLSPYVSDSEDSDLVLEADSQAEELLRGADMSDTGLHVFPSNVFEDVLKIYKKPGEENRRQKSHAGSYLLPNGMKPEHKDNVEQKEALAEASLGKEVYLEAVKDVSLEAVKEEAYLEILAPVAEASLGKEVYLEAVKEVEAYSENLGTPKEEPVRVKDEQIVGGVVTNFGDVLEEVKTDEDGVKASALCETRKLVSSPCSLRIFHSCLRIFLPQGRLAGLNSFLKFNYSLIIVFF